VKEINTSDVCLAAARIDIVLQSWLPDEQAVKSGYLGETATHVGCKAGYSKGSCYPFDFAFEYAIQQHNFEI
jgi:hypothetical protein